jgi:hypothetical protein
MGRAVEVHWHILTVLVKERFNMDMIKYEEEKEGRREKENYRACLSVFSTPLSHRRRGLKHSFMLFFFTKPASFKKVALKGVG